MMVLVTTMECEKSSFFYLVELVEWAPGWRLVGSEREFLKMHFPRRDTINGMVHVCGVDWPWSVYIYIYI
jgi:hypothetical protein